MRASQEALDVLKTVGRPVNVVEVMALMKLTSPPRSTVSRALRRMRSRGVVSSKRNGGRYVLWSYGSSQPAKVPVSTPSSKGSSRSYSIMCNPINMPILCTLVEGEVVGLVQAKKEFSAYDVTKTLREKANKGEFQDLDKETGSVYVGGVSVPKIDHDIIKEAVHEFYNQGKMSGYTRSHNGTHWVYGEVTPFDQDDDDDATDPGQNATVGPVALSGDDYDGSSSI